MQQIQAEDQKKYNEILASVRLMYVDSVNDIKKISTLRDQANSPTTPLPPVLPKSIAQLSWSAFGDLFIQH